MLKVHRSFTDVSCCIFIFPKSWRKFPFQSLILIVVGGMDGWWNENFLLQGWVFGYMYRGILVSQRNILLTFKDISHNEKKLKENCVNLQGMFWIGNRTQDILYEQYKNGYTKISYNLYSTQHLRPSWTFREYVLILTTF